MGVQTWSPSDKVNVYVRKTLKLDALQAQLAAREARLEPMRRRVTKLVADVGTRERKLSGGQKAESDRHIAAERAKAATPKVVKQPVR